MIFFCSKKKKISKEFVIKNNLYKSKNLAIDGSNDVQEKNSSSFEIYQNFEFKQHI